MFEGNNGGGSKQLTKLCGVYKNVSAKTGKTYLTGRLSFTSKLLILPNLDKQQDSEPDFNVFLVPLDEKPRNGQSKPPEPPKMAENADENGL
jgi:hypothetical protein